jgi:hypothetical protein
MAGRFNASAGELIRGGGSYRHVRSGNNLAEGAELLECVVQGVKAFAPSSA